VQVRSAGEEAWLCREAPEDPVFDASTDEHLLRPLAMSAAEATQVGTCVQDFFLMCRIQKDPKERKC